MNLPSGSAICLIFLLLLGLSSACGAAGQWSTGSLSVARDYLSALSVGSLALFAGGLSVNNTFSSVVDIYNASSGNWTTASLSQGRNVMGTASTGDLALFAGGGRAVGLGSAVVDIYNASSGDWTTASLSSPRFWLTGTAQDDIALFAGGVDPFGYASNVVDIYNASSGNWTFFHALSVPRYMIAAASVGSLSLFAGGSTTAASASAVVDIYNSMTGNWTTTALSQARLGMAAATVGDLVLFAGGGNATDALDVVDIYNATSGQWTVSRLSRPRAMMAATTVGDLVLFAGGAMGPIQGNGTPCNVVDIYNATSGAWTTAFLAQPRWSLAATTVKGMALFGGGKVSGNVGANSDVPSAAIDVCGRALSVASPSAVVEARFNLSAPAVAVEPAEAKDGQTSALQFNIGIMSLEEISSGDGSTILQAVDLQTSGWTIRQARALDAPGGGEGSEYVFASALGSSNATLHYIFNTFGSDSRITTGSNYSFSVSPALLKFSFNLTSWPWRSTSSMLRLMLRVDPPFKSLIRLDDSPQPDMSTFFFSLDVDPARDDACGLVVRLLGFGEEWPASTRVPMQAWANVDDSSFSLTFSHFSGSTLLVDPDMGLLLGDRGAGGGGTSGDTGLIIGVSVAVPAALILVVLVIALASVAVVLQRRAARASRGSVNLDDDNDANAHDL